MRNTKQPRKKLDVGDAVARVFGVLILLLIAFTVLAPRVQYFISRETRHQNAVDYAIEKRFIPGSSANITQFQRTAVNGDKYTYRGTVRIKEDGVETEHTFECTITGEAILAGPIIDFELDPPSP